MRRLQRSWSRQKSASKPAISYSEPADPLHPPQAVSTKQPLRNDRISRLPTELLLAIVDALGEYQPNRLSPIRQLSVVSKRFNDVTNHKLWRSFVIGANRRYNGLPQTDSGQIRHAVQDRCHALARNTHRSSCVESLVIKLYSSSGSTIKGLHRCLVAVPQLRSLRIELQRGNDISPSTLASFTSMLNRNDFPFQLLAFDCDVHLLSGNTSIYSFLLAQHTIERLTIGRLKKEEFWVDSLSQPIHTQSGKELLPSLRNFIGPSSYARLVTQNSTRRLESIHLIAQHTDVDVENGSKALAASSLDSLGLVDSFALWTNGLLDPVDIDARIPQLLTASYGINPHSIRYLKVGCITACFSVHHSIETFPIRILNDFSSLESLEWTSAGLQGLRSALSILRKERRAGLLEFIQECEKCCRSLRRIMFLEREERLLELVRRQGSERIDGSGPTLGDMPMKFQSLERGHTAMSTATALDPELPGTTLLHSSSGSVWTVQNRSLNNPIAFYPAQPL